MLSQKQHRNLARGAIWGNIMEHTPDIAKHTCSTTEAMRFIRDKNAWPKGDQNGIIYTRIQAQTDIAHE